MDGVIFSLQNILANYLNLSGNVSNIYNPVGTYHFNIIDTIKCNIKFTKEYYISNLNFFYTKEEFIRDNLNFKKNREHLEDLLNPQ